MFPFYQEDCGFEYLLVTKDTDDGNIMYSVQNLSLTSPSILSRKFGCISSDEAAIAEKKYICNGFISFTWQKEESIEKHQTFVKTF